MTAPASPYWVPNDSSSNWITPDGFQNPPNYDGQQYGWPNTAPAGYYYYTLYLNNVPAGAAVTGQWATDNPGAIFLNGVETANKTAGWSDVTANMTDQQTYLSFTSFSLSGFKQGANTLQFVVYNIRPGAVTRLA